MKRPRITSLLAPLPPLHHHRESQRRRRRTRRQGSTGCSGGALRPPDVVLNSAVLRHEDDALQGNPSLPPPHFTADTSHPSCSPSPFIITAGISAVINDYECHQSAGNWLLWIVMVIMRYAFTSLSDYRRACPSRLAGAGEEHPSCAGAGRLVGTAW